MKRSIEPLYSSATESTPNLLVSKEIQSPNKERGIPPSRADSAAQHLPEPHDTFVLVSRPSSVALTNSVASGHSTMERNSLSHRLKIANKLFELASGMSFVEHPLCQDCADDLMIRLEKRLGSLKKERDAYLSYLDELEKNKWDSCDEVSLSEEELQEVNAIKRLMCDLIIGL
jgi:beclin 1